MPEYAFIKAAFGQPHTRVPIWIMRQAGRYLPEYNAVREKVSFTELCESPKLVAEVTRQPIDIFGFDSAIIFSDILLPLEPMGVKVTYEEGGPKIYPPVRTPDDVAGLKSFDPGDAMKFALDGIAETKDVLRDAVPLIGFCGAPFTLACYLVEGGGSANYTEIKKFLFTHPKDAAVLLNRLAEIVGEYLRLQIQAGCDAIQVFDSWGGILSPDLYARYSIPYLKTVFEMCETKGVPRIMYMNNSRPYLPLLAELPCEVISVDWRTDLGDARSILDGKTIQGNLDPHLLLGPPDLMVQQTSKILECMADTDAFIFNLGHGILPPTPVKQVKLLVDTVHSFERPRETQYSHNRQTSA